MNNRTTPEIDVEDVEPKSSEKQQEKHVPVAGQDKLTTKAVMTLIGCWLIELIVGGQLAMGNVTVYFVSYYRLVLGYEVDDDTFYPMAPILVILSSVFYPIGNLVINYFNDQSRPLIMMTAAFSLSCVVLCAFVALPPWLFITIYSLAMGVFKGCMTPALLKAGWSHLPLRKGLVSGTIISAMGIGGFVYSLLIS